MIKLSEDEICAALILTERQRNRAKPFTPSQILNMAVALCMGDQFCAVALMGYLPSKYYWVARPKWLSIWKRDHLDDVADWVTPTQKTAFGIAGAIRDDVLEKIEKVLRGRILVASARRRR